MTVRITLSDDEQPVGGTPVVASVRPTAPRESSVPVFVDWDDDQ